MPETMILICGWQPYAERNALTASLYCAPGGSHSKPGAAIGLDRRALDGDHLAGKRRRDVLINIPATDAAVGRAG